MSTTETRRPPRRHVGGAGPLLRAWRDRRRRSQMDLAQDVGVSTRHLSFVETGRAKPSPELVLAIAEHLDVPLRERNTLLVAAGFAPRYHETPLDAPDMERMTASLQRMLDAHDPYPGVVLDRHWNVLLTNVSAALLASGLPPELTGPPLNVFRVSLHPDGLASRTVNFDEWGAYMITTLRRQVSLTGDRQLSALLDEVSQYPNVAELIGRKGWLSWPETALLVPFQLDFDGVRLSMFTTLTTFGTPRDITLDEIAVELFFPADDETERILRGRT